MEKRLHHSSKHSIHKDTTEDTANAVSLPASQRKHTVRDVFVVSLLVSIFLLTLLIVRYNTKVNVSNQSSATPSLSMVGPITRQQAEINVDKTVSDTMHLSSFTVTVSGDNDATWLAQVYDLSRGNTIVAWYAVNKKTGDVSVAQP